MTNVCVSALLAHGVAPSFALASKGEHPRRTFVTFTAVVAGPAAPACGRAAHPSRCINHSSSGRGQSVFQVLAPEARVLEDLKCTLEDCSLSHSMIDRVAALEGMAP